MPLINVKKVWTPLELFGIEILHASEDRHWYIKRPRRPLKRLF